MAVIHISRAEAATDFDGLLARVRAGERVIIEENTSPIAVLQPPSDPHVRMLSESLRLAEEHGSTATLDEDFAKDLEAVINSHPESITDPWA